jgi:hypothetical protein
MAAGEPVDLTAFRTVETTNDPEGLKDELITSLGETDGDQLNMITELVIGRLRDDAVWYSEDLVKLIKYLSNPIVMCCIDHYLKDNRGRVADLILSYIFIMPLSDNFRIYDIVFESDRHEDPTWEIRENIPKELHGLVFKLIDSCLRKWDEHTSRGIPPLGVLPMYVFEYISTTWLEQNQPAIKSSIKK